VAGVGCMIAVVIFIIGVVDVVIVVVIVIGSNNRRTIKVWIDVSVECHPMKNITRSRGTISAGGGRRGTTRS